MHVTLVHVHVVAESVDAFLDATRENHEGAVREAGNVRFDVLRDATDPLHFLLYEAYVDAAAAAAHKETGHYLAWRESVAPMMAEPRRGESWIGLLPDSAADA